MYGDNNEDGEISYYAGGFRKMIGGVPCKVYSRRLPDGRWINAKDSPYYNPLYDDPKHGISRLERDPAVIEAAQEALAARSAPKPRVTKAKAPEKPVEATPPVSAPIAHEAPVPVPAAREAAMAALLERRGFPVAVLVPAVANDNDRRAPRTAAERRAIIRAWRMRAERRSMAIGLEAFRHMERVNHEGMVEAEAARDAAIARAADFERIATANAQLAEQMERRADDEAARAVQAEAQAMNARDGATAYKREGDRLEAALKASQAEARATAARLDAVRAMIGGGAAVPRLPGTATSSLAIGRAMAGAR